MSDPAPLMLSVSGARGIVDASMTEAVAARFAAAWGSILAVTAVIVAGLFGMCWMSIGAFIMAQMVNFEI